MRLRGRSGAWVVGLAATLVLPMTVTAAAHVRKAAGPYSVELGWAEEPAYSGVRNAIEVTAEDSAGRAAADPRASLRVDVSFGQVHRDLALAPAGEPGTFAAAIVPTRPGTYAFHVRGTLRGRRIDIAATCGDSTFECVQGADAIQFPVAEPSGSELAAKLDRAAARAERGEDDAAQATKLATAALVAAGLGLLAALGVVLRARRG